MKKTIKIIIYVSAILQFIGGSSLLYVFYKDITSPNNELLANLLLVVPAVILNFSGAITLLYVKSSKGVVISIINYIIQVIQFQFMGLYYFYAVGPYVGLGFVKESGHHLSFWSDKALYLFTIIFKNVGNKENYYLTINLIAIFFLIVTILEYANRKEKLNKKTVANKSS